MITDASTLKHRYPKALDRTDDSEIERLIDEFTEIAERYRGCTFEPTSTTVTLRGSGACQLVVPFSMVTSVDAITIDGVAQNVGDVTLWPEGVLEWSTTWPSGDAITVTVTHGYTTPPDVLVTACGEYVRSEAPFLRTNAPRNTISYTDDSGFSYRESTPDFGAGRPTGWIAVDRRLNQLPDMRVPL